MAAELVFAPLASDWHEGVQTSIIIGTKTALTSIASIAPCSPSLFQALLDNLKPGTDLEGDSRSSWIEKSGVYTQLVLCAVTDFCSRHNAPARPDQFFTTLKKLIPTDKSSSIVVAIEKAEYAFSIGCAIARLLPLYSRKGYSKAPKGAEPRSKKAKSEPQPSARKVTVHFAVAAGPKEIDLDSIRAAAQGVRYTAKLVDMPTSELTTTRFIEKATKLVAPLRSVKMTVIRGEDLAKEGLNGIYGVGKAAVEPPALVVLSYSPAAAKKTVAWVGKGIVYDTGGLSLKGPEFMVGMKRDMGGAAAILSAFVAAVSSSALDYTLHAVLCLAENAMGPKAQRPDDIVYMYSGKTVEVNNTDAEGRLVLGDGIAYSVKNLNPDFIFDMATLTGAQGISTGKHHAAIVCNDDDLEAKVVKAGKSSGDLVHPLLYCPEFLRSEFASDVADMKNSVKVRTNAQSSCAAQFIANHLGQYQKPWCHIDMAYPASIDERATGYGVALLLELSKAAL
eukprot:TRINITY_DN8743_c0_g1_i1.p1 TRINITY_DN8743_c0_g1~~TRINITY_DN8743_c0_g1_i1.p1  ORF type:complete len:506 (-),score=179.10 TRINITY_DN8743_c0_g1_i1:194-1711(-)